MYRRIMGKVQKHNVHIDRLIQSDLYIVNCFAKMACSFLSFVCMNISMNVYMIIQYDKLQIVYQQDIYILMTQRNGSFLVWIMNMENITNRIWRKCVYHNVIQIQSGA